ncbi:hypothetical protein PCANC_06311 [Puccinia coronata f. sp. avenae]|uniref:Uncharacterized protein n=1 Tax=Puccinia coronata f. sp. avenae TaxID=200324 RepID=A0A2N5SAJ8_9BASI|nr:hypothetical protein PCANC_23768 [Puccinia coronata f. sp. avenae]PLW46012.1 hypothetical protein PCASD_03457 [Puccinia coronata f. sp. avenae]PLW52645.1 hypothetical protein PCANC_06311 [Puccinia coronata f. sp. avenae]
MRNGDSERMQAFLSGIVVPAIVGGNPESDKSIPALLRLSSEHTLIHSSILEKITSIEVSIASATPSGFFPVVGTAGLSGRLASSPILKAG